MPSVNGNLYFITVQSIVNNLAILQIGHFTACMWGFFVGFFFFLYWCLKVLCAHKIRGSFYGKRQVLKVIFITSQYRLRSFCNFS